MELNEYEKHFDDYYRDEFKHTEGIPKEKLLLNAYPYTIDLSMPEGGRWLELGIGTGRVVYANQDIIIGKNIHCVGIDISKSGIDHCRKYLPKSVELYVGDIKNLPQEVTKHKYDLITLFGTIQATPKDQWFARVVELKSLLKPGGRIGLSLHPNSWLEYVRCIKSPQNRYGIVTEEYLTAELKKHGQEGKYKIEKHDSYTLLMKLTRYFGLKPVLWFSFEEYFDTNFARVVTKMFKAIFPQFVFGHWWIWIYN